MSHDPIVTERSAKKIAWQEISPEQRAEIGRNLHLLVTACDDWEEQEHPNRFDAKWLQANGYDSLVEWANQTLGQKILGLIQVAPDHVRQAFMGTAPTERTKPLTIPALQVQVEGAHVLWQDDRNQPDDDRPDSDITERFTSDVMQRLGYEELVDHLTRTGEIEQWIAQSSPAVRADFALTDWERYTPGQAEQDFIDQTTQWRDIIASNSATNQRLEVFLQTHAPLLYKYLERTGGLSRVHNVQFEYNRTRQEVGKEAYYAGVQQYVRSRILYEALGGKHKPAFERFMELRFPGIESKVYASDTEIQSTLNADLVWKVPLLISVCNALSGLIKEHGRETVLTQLVEIDPQLASIIDRDFGSIEEIIGYVDQGGLRAKKSIPKNGAIKLSTGLYLDVSRAHLEWQQTWSRQPFTSTWLQQHGYVQLVNWVNKNGMSNALIGVPPRVEQDLQLRKNWHRHTLENAQTDLAELYERWQQLSEVDRPSWQGFVRKTNHGLFLWLHRQGKLREMLDTTQHNAVMRVTE